MNNFDSMPLVCEGESKIIRYVGNGMVAIKYKPTIYSFTHNRAGVVEGTDLLRLRASSVFLNVLKNADIPHAYQTVNLQEQLVYSNLLMTKKSDGYEFTPTDGIDPKKLKLTCPIEVVVKSYHVGTPKHRYYGIEQYPTWYGEKITAGKKYSQQRVIRFDWRNPITDSNGVRLADECMPDDMACWYIKAFQAKCLAGQAFSVLSQFLYEREIEIMDICFLISSDGETIYSEISQDCARFKYQGESLDKDIWRSGGSDEMVVRKWEKILELIGG